MRGRQNRVCLLIPTEDVLICSDCCGEYFLNHAPSTVHRVLTEHSSPFNQKHSPRSRRACNVRSVPNCTTETANVAFILLRWGPTFLAILKKSKIRELQI